MSLNCLITVRATGSHGSPKVDMTDKVSRFLRDSDHYYRAVFQHLNGIKNKTAACAVCDPAEVLSGFLENRKRRQSGRISGGLMRMAVKYRRHFGAKIPIDLMKSYLIQSFATDPMAFFEAIGSLVDPEDKDAVIGAAVKFEISAWKSEMRASLPRLILDARRIQAGKRIKGETVRDIPFWNIRRGGKLDESVRGLLEDHSSSMSKILDAVKRDWSKDGDPDVAKAATLLGALDYARAERALPPGYESHADPDVRALARYLTATTIMES